MLKAVLAYVFTEGSRDDFMSELVLERLEAVEEG